MNGLTRFPSKRAVAAPRLGGPPVTIKATGYPWADGEILYAADLNAAIAAAGAANIGRNLLHNSLFNVAQRGTGPWSVSGYTADRWAQYFVNGSISTSVIALADSARVAIGDEAAAKALNVTFAGGATGGSTTQIYQPVEDVRRLSGKTVTLSFWAWVGSGTLKIGVSLDQNFGTGGSPSAGVTGAIQVVTITPAVARYALTFSVPSAYGKTLGTNGNDFTNLNLFLSSQAIVAVGVQSGNFDIWGLQLEIGGVITPLEKLDPRYEMSNCQRFYQTGVAGMRCYDVAGAAIGIITQLPVTMRAGPTMILTNPNYTNCSGGVVQAFGGLGSYQASAIVTATGDANFYFGFGASADL